MAEVQRVSTSQEAHFTDGDGGTPRVQDTNNYVSVLSMDKYRFMDHAYYGTDGFRDGSYLIPHDREMFYQKRRDFSVYKNFVKPIVNALVDPVFAEEAPRTITVGGSEEEGAPIARAFIEDVDGAGADMQYYMAQTCAKARLHGVCFSLIDNFTADTMPETVEQSIYMRTYPYVIRKSAWEVVEAKTDDIGRMVEIWFSEPSRVDATGTYERARCWTSQYSVIMERCKNSNDERLMIWHEAEPRIVHGLGVIPVACTYATARASSHEVLPDPPLYDIARMNHLIYNKDSEIRDLERSQAFAILYLQSDIGGNITLSNHNAIIIPPGSTITPGYISPDSTNLQTLVQNNTVAMEDLFRSAEQSGVHAVQTSVAASGVALAWRFWGIDNQLRKTAKAATETEEQIMEILAMYTGETYEYSVDYPTTYQPGDRMQEVNALKTIIDMQPPKALKKIVFGKIVSLLMVESTEEEQKEVIDAVDAEYEQEQEVEPEKPVDVIGNGRGEGNTAIE